MQVSLNLRGEMGAVFGFPNGWAVIVCAHSPFCNSVDIRPYIMTQDLRAQAVWVEHCTDDPTYVRDHVRDNDIGPVLVEVAAWPSASIKLDALLKSKHDAKDIAEAAIKKTRGK